MRVNVPDADRRDELRLADGRILAWSEWGPGEGRPVLFCTGAGMSGTLGFGAEALDVLRLRLVAIDRPGTGRSEPHPEGTLDGWRDDVRQLIHARELDGPLAVGFSLGAPFALALAAGGDVAAVAIVSGLDDLADPAFAGAVEPAVAEMVAAARADRQAFEARFADAGPERLRRRVIDGAGAADRSVYLAEPFASAYDRSLRAGFRQGPGGYAHDLALGFRAWPFRPEDVRVPADVWYGAEDVSPVHSPDRGWRLATRLPRGRRLELPGEGGSLLWTRSAEVLRLLRAAPLRP